MCTDCNEITIPIGPSGVDGENAFTILTASYVQPAVNTNVTISVSDSGQYGTDWCAIGQIIYVAVGGYYEVVSKTSTSITIKYTSDYTTYNQSLTASGGTVSNSGIVSPGGIVGLMGNNGSNGTSGTTILATYNNISGNALSANLLETTLFTTNLPANTLGTNGDEMELFMYSTYNSATDVTLRIKLGAKIVTINYGAALPDVIQSFFKIKISRISQTSQSWMIEELSTDVTGAKYVRNIIADSSAVDLATILTFEITAQNAVATANTFLLYKSTLYKYKI